MDLVLLVIGFVLLVKGADFFVGGASSIAKKFHVPSLVIGLTLVAMGTSAPELAVSITAGLKGSNEIALANVTGSNMFNLLVVLGVCSIIKPYVVKKQVLLNDYPFSLVATFLLFGLVLENFLGGGKSGFLSQADGIVLCVLFIYFLYITIVGAKNHPEEQEGEEIVEYSIGKSILLTIIGLAGVIIGGDFVVEGASGIARFLGMSENVIGLTIVAIGTSLPELVTSIVATKKGQTDIAIGNVVGSNIFNLLFVLGASVTVNGIPVGINEFVDLIFLMATTTMCYIMLFTGKKLTRGEGIVMLSCYIAYMAYAVMR